MLGAALLCALAASQLPSAANAQDRWDWSGGDASDSRAYQLHGPGVAQLVPALRDTRRGQAFVMRNFDSNRDGRINPREARAANRAFISIAGRDRDHFDWERRGHHGESAQGPRVGSGDWDRQGMRDYHFRQGRYGAMLTLQDTLFKTGSADLRPGMEARLQPLAGYLRANPRTRLRIDGFTDSVGSTAANLTLSRDRARAVADALSAMEVDGGRLQLEGHGEALPVAANTTSEGRQLNRRVEVSLVDQQARSFD
jgi:outer membrane protein OmpA-like peptidoglycan-associated protein